MGRGRRRSGRARSRQRLRAARLGSAGQEGGVRPGQVIGASDKNGGYPSTTPYSPDDIGATVYTALGIDPHAEVRDRLGRPVQLNRGRVIQPLFDGTGD